MHAMQRGCNSCCCGWRPLCNLNTCTQHRFLTHISGNHNHARPLSARPACPLPACLQIRFKHVDTGVYLVSHDAKFGNPIGGQQEICGLPRKVREADWMAAEGVYYPRTDVTGHDEL